MNRFARVASISLGLLILGFGSAGRAQDGLSNQLPDVAELKIILESSQDPLKDAPKSEVKKAGIIFLDTKDLELSKLGVVLRIRIWSADEAEVTVKLRPLRFELPKDWFGWAKFKVESDVVGESVIDAAALSHTINDRELIARASNERLDPRDWLGAKQIEMLKTSLEKLGATEGLGILSRALTFGIIDSRIWTFGKDGVQKIEEWTLPSGKRILELSTKVPTYRAICRQLLDKLKLKADPHPRTKTDEVLKELKPRN